MKKVERERVDSWIRSRFLELIPNKYPGEWLSRIFVQMDAGSRSSASGRFGLRPEKFKRWAVLVLDRLVEEGAIAREQVVREGVKPPNVMTYYRRRNLLEQLAWVSRDPEPPTPVV
jgi:hypothetical protein